eukprot:COSAG01_NODE_13800_length_1533_cov_2509.401674_5_plen_30_part_01
MTNLQFSLLHLVGTGFDAFLHQLRGMHFDL